MNIGKKKALVLSHCTDNDETSGLDIQQIFDRLGFRRENLYIVEREKEVYERMKVSKIFEGTNLFNLELDEFKSNICFDVLYLDLKCQSNERILKTLERLLIYNVHNGTVIYLNFLGAREFDNVKSYYEQIEKEYLKEFNLIIKDCNEKVNLCNEMQKELENFDYYRDLILLMTEKNLKSSEMEITKEKSKIKMKIPIAFLNAINKNPKLANYFELFLYRQFNEKIGLKYKKEREEFIERKNNHLIRKETIQFFLKGLYDILISNYDKFDEIREVGKYANGKFFKIPFPIGITLFDNYDSNLSEDKKKKRQDLKGLIRFMSKSLTIQYVYQFIYFGEKRSPLINTLCYLQSTEEILKQNGLYNFIKIILETFLIFYLHFSKRLLKRDNLQKGLYLWEILNAVKEGGNPFDPTKRRDTENQMREKFNRLHRIYKELRNLKIINISDKEIRAFLFNWKGESYRYTYTIDKENYKISKKSSASHIIFTFYIVMEFINLLENTMKRNVMFGKVNTIDFDNEENIEDQLKKYIKDIKSLGEEQIIKFKDQINRIEEICKIVGTKKDLEDPNCDERRKNTILDIEEMILEPIRELMKEDKKFLPRKTQEKKEKKEKKEKRRKDKEPRIRVQDKNGRVKLDNLSKGKLEKRNAIADKYLIKYGKYSKIKMKSSDIAVKINKDLYRKNGKYPNPLFDEYNLRARLAHIKMKADKKKKAEEDEEKKIGWSEERWEEEKKKAIADLEKENNEKKIMDYLNSKKTFEKMSIDQDS